jgi:two-component system, NarL family, sensor histidine kinase DesK
MAGFCAVALLVRLRERRGAGDVVLCVSYMLAILGLQTLYLSRPGAESARWRYLALLAQAALVYLPMLQFKQAWVALPGFLAGSLLLILPLRIGWALCILVIASMGVIENHLDGSALAIGFTVASTVITAGVIYGLTRLSILLDEVVTTRMELAALAVQAERARFSRDIHDVLGVELSAITLKAELAQRLVDDSPADAVQQLAEIGDISRHAREDVRAVARGGKQLSLESEVERIGALLGAANIEPSVCADLDPLPGHLATTLALILREGITNVIRHSDASRCAVTVGATEQHAFVEIVNDGVLQSCSPDSTERIHGLVNLDARAEALGGQVRAGSPDGASFVLRADLPLAPA